MKLLRATVTGAAVLAGLAVTSIVVAQATSPAGHHGGLSRLEHHSGGCQSSSTSPTNCLHHTRNEGQSEERNVNPSQPI